MDIGGPNTTIGHWGISLGGILSGVLAGSEPSLDAVSPNAGGAGLTQISSRASQGGVPEAVGLPILGPLVLGCVPTDEHQNPVEAGADGIDCFDGKGQAEGPFSGGTLRLAFLLNNSARSTMREFGAIEGVEPGDRVVLRNLRNGEEKAALIGERGWFRLSVAADALGPIERRPLIGLSGDAAGVGSVSDNTQLGDPLSLTVYVGESESVRGSVDSFERELEFQGTRYGEGSTLVAMQEGMGLDRNTPAYRRFLALAQHALAPGDPGTWMPHVWMYPLDVGYDPHTEGGNSHVLVMPTAGDSNVPVSTGVAMGRTAGLLGDWRRDETLPPEQGWRELFSPDPRYGTSADQWLADTYVLEGIATLQRYGDNALNPNVLFDPDNVSDGEATWSCGDSDWSALIGENECPAELEGMEVFFGIPHPDPGAALRADHAREDGSFDGLRVPVLRPAGQHGIYNAQSFRTFDADAYMVNMSARFLGTAGGTLQHEAGCDCSSGAVPGLLVNGSEDFSALGDRACTGEDTKVCDASCTQAWGMVTPPGPIVCAP